MGCIQQKHRIKEARLILQEYTFFVTNISQGTAFLLQGRTYNIGNKKYIFRTVKSAMLLLFDISTYS